LPAFDGPNPDPNFTTFSFQPIVFAAPAAVTQGTVYAIVLLAPGAAPNIYWRCDLSDPACGPNRYEWAGVSAGAYPGGMHRGGIGPTWEDDSTAVDLAFKTYITEPAPAATVHFLKPLDETTDATAIVINDGSKSRTLPIKVQLSADGSPITGPSSGGAVVTLGAPVKVVCSSGATTDGADAAAGTGSTVPSTFRWNDEGFWQLNLDMKQIGLTSGSCYELDVYLNGDKLKNAFAVYRPTSK